MSIWWRIAALARIPRDGAASSGVKGKAPGAELELLDEPANLKLTPSDREGERRFEMAAADAGANTAAAFMPHSDSSLSTAIDHSSSAFRRQYSRSFSQSNDLYPEARFLTSSSATSFRRWMSASEASCSLRNLNSAMRSGCPCRKSVTSGSVDDERRNSTSGSAANTRAKALMTSALGGRSLQRSTRLR